MDIVIIGLCFYILDNELKISIFVVNSIVVRDKERFVVVGVI